MFASAQIFLMIDAVSAGAVPGLNADGSLSRGRVEMGASSIMTTAAPALRSDWSSRTRRRRASTGQSVDRRVTASIHPVSWVGMA
jgi:hypothetical protein